MKATRSIAPLVVLVVGLSGCAGSSTPGPIPSVADPASIIDVNQTWTDPSMGLSITIQKISPMVLPSPVTELSHGAGGGIDDSSMVGFRVVRDDSSAAFQVTYADWYSLFQLVAADNSTGPCFEMEHPSSGYSSDVNEKLQARTDAILAAVGGDVAFGAADSANEGWLVCYITKDVQRSFNAPGAVLKYTRLMASVIGSSQILPEFSFSVPLT